MSTTIKIDNYSTLNVIEKTALTEDVEAAATSLPLENNQNFAADDYILVGQPGSESAEIRTVDSVSGANTAVADALTQRHNQYEQVLKLFGNKIRVYRAANSNGTPPADGSFSLLDEVAIDPDQLQTKYTDSAGSSGYWYKFVYYNETTDTETALADCSAGRGGGIGQYATLDSIRGLAGFANNPNISDSLVEEYRQAAQAQINGALGGHYTVPFEAPINPLISQITRLIAAGNLQLAQYGAYNVSDTNNGKLKVDEGEALLKKIVDRKYVLNDIAGNDTPTTNDLGFSGYPNGNTQDSQGNNGFLFERTGLDGFNSRKY